MSTAVTQHGQWCGVARHTAGKQHMMTSACPKMRQMPSAEANV